MKNNPKKVLVIVAHTDDESFGCGGLIRKLSSAKYIVRAISFTNGVGSRSAQNKILIKLRKENSLKASKILGFKWLQQFDYPDNEMDTVSMLEIIQKIEKYKKKFLPDIVITHNFSDLNIDHRIVAEATLTAFRPEPNSNCSQIITFEVPSSTDYRILKRSNNFIPNYFVKIDKFLDYKIKAIKAYKKEVKKAPHTRSIEGIKNLSKIRGNQSGVKYAEAFEIIRKIEK